MNLGRPQKNAANSDLTVDRDFQAVIVVMSVPTPTHGEPTRVVRNVVRRAESRFRSRLDSLGTGDLSRKGGDHVCSENQERLA